MTQDKNTKAKVSKTILLAFILNLGFSLIEFIFGLIFRSSAILADAVHDVGDAVAIGLSYYLEKVSDRQKDSRYTLGYKRFSLLGAMVTATILITGSVMIIAENMVKLVNPEPVNHQGMLILGLIAIVVNVSASFLFKDGHSHQEKILSLHFLEDILGWLGVILVALILRWTNWYILDPLLSLLISAFILTKAVPQFWRSLQIFLEKAPEDLALEALSEQIKTVDGVLEVSQLNVWSLDGIRHVAMVHVLIAEEQDQRYIKDQIHHLFEDLHIVESAVELDYSHLEHGHHTQVKEIDQHHAGHSH